MKLRQQAPIRPCRAHSKSKYPQQVPTSPKLLLSAIIKNPLKILLDSDGDPDYNKNQIISSLRHCTFCLKVS